MKNFSSSLGVVFNLVTITDPVYDWFARQHPDRVRLHLSAPDAHWYLKAARRYRYFRRGCQLRREETILAVTEQSSDPSCCNNLRAKNSCRSDARKVTTIPNRKAERCSNLRASCKSKGRIFAAPRTANPNR